MKTWLCACKGAKRCIHAEVKTIQLQKPIWATSYRTHPVTALSIYCKATGKNIHKFITECKLYSNITLTEMFEKATRHPEYLPKIPYTNTCTCCNGTGYFITKMPTVWCGTGTTNKRFMRENCEFCGGKGIIRKKIEKIDVSKTMQFYPFSFPLPQEQ